MENTENLWTAAQVSRYLGIKPHYFYSNIMRTDPIKFTVNKITGRKLYSKSDVDQWRKKREAKVTG